MALRLLVESESLMKSQLAKIILGVGFAVMGATVLPAQATMDWNAATDAWRGQYRALAVAEAAREACGLDVPKSVRRAMKEAREGLRDALASFGTVETPRALIKATGGKEAFCADTAMMAEAKAAVAAFSAQAQEDGNKTKPIPSASARSSLSAAAPTPVVDPNIALIRNCRKAVIAKLGKRAEKNDAFWPTYESCMKDQGAGWF